MPLWRVYSHPKTFSPSQRDAIAKTIIDLYVHKIDLPPFYVDVIFIDCGDHSTYLGGHVAKNFVRITVEQIARVMPADTDEAGLAYRQAWLDTICQALHPHIGKREELQWEMHIAETPRSLWRVQGIDPPPWGSEAEKKWKVENKATEWKHANGVHH